MSEPGKKKFFSNTQWSEKFLEVLLLFSLHGLNLFLSELKSKYVPPVTQKYTIVGMVQRLQHGNVSQKYPLYKKYDFKNTLTPLRYNKWSTKVE